MSPNTTPSAASAIWRAWPPCSEDFSVFMNDWGSEPAAPAEPPQRQYRSRDHQEQRVGISPRPVQLRHVFEVHAVQSADQGRREECDRRNGEDLDDLVLFDADQAQR